PRTAAALARKRWRPRRWGVAAATAMSARGKGESPTSFSSSGRQTGALAAHEEEQKTEREQREAEHHAQLRVGRGLGQRHALLRRDRNEDRSRRRGVRGEPDGRRLRAIVVARRRQRGALAKDLVEVPAGRKVARA